MLIPARQRGIGLIELMLSLLLGLLVAGAATSLFSVTYVRSREAMQLARLDQDTRQIANAALRDLARTGYWQAMEAIALSSARFDLQLSGSSGSVSAEARDDEDAPAPAFDAPLSAAMLVGRTLVVAAADDQGEAGVYSLRIEAVSGGNRLSLTMAAGANLPTQRIAAGSWSIVNPFGVIDHAGHCIVFSYDENADGLRGEQERYGYRHDTAEWAAETVNNANGCGSGSWQNFSDERSLRLTQLQLLLPSSTNDAGNGLSLAQRTAELNLQANGKLGLQATRMQSGRVRLRNDAYAP